MSICDTKFLALARTACACTLFLASSAMAATLESSDNFDSANYTGGSGWGGNWTESGDDGASNSGDIQINSQQLRFVGDSGGSNGFIFRELDLSALSTEGGALLFFDISFEDTLETMDIFEVYASVDGGTNWTEIRQFNGEVPFESDTPTTNRQMTLDISEFIGSNTAIRFGVASGVTGAGEAFNIDNVEIFSTPAALSLETDEFFGGTDLPTASSSNSTDAAQIFDGSNQPYSDDGLVISFDGPANGPVMLFDTGDPTGGDTDLGAPNGDDNENANNCGANDGITIGSNPGVGGDADGDLFNDAALGSAGENCRPLGNTLIVSTDGDATDPDDDASGATISFDFDAPVEFGALRFIDDLAGSVTLRFADGTTAETVNFMDLIDFPGQGENGVFFASFKDFDKDTDVIGIDVTLEGSGTVGTLFGQPPGVDFGDAPDSYATDLADGGEGIGPSHRIEPNGFPLHLGSAPDSESDGQPSSDASGDDAGASTASPETVADFDDEDGIGSFPDGCAGSTCEPGDTYSVEVSATNETGNAALLCGWIDFNDDGDFDNQDAIDDDGGQDNDEERACASVPTGTSNVTVTLDFEIPDDFADTGASLETFVSRFRITTDWSASTDAAPTGSATDGEVEDYAIPLESLPVSIHSFDSRYTTEGLVLEWGTVSETRNAGFFVWGDFGNGLELLTPEMVPAKAVDPVRPHRYQVTVPGVFEGQVDDLAVTAVDHDGDEKVFGMFRAGQSYGKKVDPAPLGWGQIGADVRARLAEHAASSASRGNDGSVGAVDVRASAVGLHEITWGDLASAGLDLTGVDPAQIAVTLKGKPVARDIAFDVAPERGAMRRAGLLKSVREQSRGSEAFGPGDVIRFWAERPKIPDALYLDDYTYRISLDPALARQASSENSKPKPGPATALKRIRQDIDAAYNFGSPLDDPWYAARLRADRNNLYETVFEVDSALAAGESGRIEAVVSGLTDFPENPDHRIQLEVNGELLVDQTFEGQTVISLGAQVSPSLLRVGSNTVRVIAPGGTEAPGDISLVDTVTLEYPRALSAAGDRIVLEQMKHTGGLTVSGLTTTDTVAYAWDGNNLVRLAREQFSRGSVRVPTVDAGVADYWISSVDAVRRPSEVSAVPDVSLLDGVAADLVIIAHPAFMPLSPDEPHPLNDYLATKQGQGWSPAVFDVHQIQQQFGHGMALPEAVTSFLREADHRFEFEHVLLVGGDSYDYTDNLGLGSISFIPTHYAPTRFIPHTPSDNLLADIDGDGVSDKALGRWPVRTMGDLSAIVTKTLDWSGGTDTLSNGAWVADSQDPNQPSFAAQLDEMVAPLFDAGWPANSVERILLDEVQPEPGVSNVDAARQAYFDRLEIGRSLSGFVGHGAPAMWTFQGLLTPDDIDGLYNEGRPTLIGTLTCYTSYFVSPFSDTVAHRWMNGYRENAAGDRIAGVPNGAVAIHGAATLSNYDQNGWFARNVLELQLAGRTLGQAVLEVRELASPSSDQVINWTLLGDPTIAIRQ